MNNLYLIYVFNNMIDNTVENKKHLYFKHIVNKAKQL